MNGNWKTCIESIAAACLAILAQAAQAVVLPAFDGAQGFGTTTRHARGHGVCVVTTLADPPVATGLERGSKTSLRACLDSARQSGGGYILFAASGTIRLAAPLMVPSNVYIAGQSSPGGIAIEGGALLIDHARHVVVRHIRHRESASLQDAIGIRDASHVVIDHVSISGFKDGAIDITRHSHDVTVQWSHLGDAIDSGDPRERYHGQPQLISTGANRVSLHHNLYTHVHTRAPLVVESATRPGFQIEFSNNVVYNYGKYPSRFAAVGGLANIIGNVYLPGFNTHSDAAPEGKLMDDAVWEGGRLENGHKPPIVISNGTRVHLYDNLMLDGVGHDATNFTDRFGKQITTGKRGPVLGLRTRADEPQTRVAVSRRGKTDRRAQAIALTASRFESMPAVDTQPAAEIVDIVLRDFGAHPRDRTDQRLEREVRQRGGRWKYSRPRDLNDYLTAAPPADHDGDGLPDAFELRAERNLEPNGRDIDPRRDNIEIYLEERHRRLMAGAKGVVPAQGLTPAAAISDR